MAKLVGDLIKSEPVDLWSSFTTYTAGPAIGTATKIRPPTGITINGLIPNTPTVSAQELNYQLHAISADVRAKRDLLFLPAFLDVEIAAGGTYHLRNVSEAPYNYEHGCYVTVFENIDPHDFNFRFWVDPYRFINVIDSGAPPAHVTASVSTSVPVPEFGSPPAGIDLGIPLVTNEVMACLDSVTKDCYVYSGGLGRRFTWPLASLTTTLAHDSDFALMAANNGTVVIARCYDAGANRVLAVTRLTDRGLTLIGTTNLRTGSETLDTDFASHAFMPVYLEYLPESFARPAGFLLICRDGSTYTSDTGGVWTLQSGSRYSSGYYLSSAAVVGGSLICIQESIPMVSFSDAGHGLLHISDDLGVTNRSYFVPFNYVYAGASRLFFMQGRSNSVWNSYGQVWRPPAAATNAMLFKRWGCSNPLTRLQFPQNAGEVPTVSYT